ncbi:MAG: response regulator transcription factor [Bacteroidales bacterium]|nr:response regulator transcription factor [Bacteroidales bacterium]
MDNKKYRILLVDDEIDVLEFVGYNLRREGYDVYTAQDGKSALEKAREVMPHLTLLDVMMPTMDGMETCEELRKIPGAKDSIIVFLTARGEDYSQIAGFESGADDYVTKPVKPKVLISRIKALLRRQGTLENQEQPSGQIESEGLVIDKDRYVVITDKEEVTLPKKEFELLSLLSSKPNKVFTREEIFDKIWGDDVIVGDRTIDVHVRKIREKIGLENIKTVKGVGYKFETGK